MIKAKSLYHLILYSIIFIIILISSFTFIIINNAFDQFQEKIEIIKSTYILKQKDTIRIDIEKTLNFIHYYNNKFKKTKSQEEIKIDILEAINLMKNKQDINDYIFIYKDNGLSIYYPLSKKNIGKNLYNLTDKNGIKVIKEVIKVSKDKAGGFVQYLWYKPELKKDVPKISFSLSYEPWNWTIGKGVYLDEIDKLVKEKREQYDQKISNYILQILSLTIMLVLYSIFIYKNATILIVNDVKEIGKYLKESQNKDTQPNQNKIIFGEFKVIANFARDAMDKMKVKTSMLEDLNTSLEDTIKGQNKELLALVESQKQFLKNSVHEINTPLAIIQTNIDLLRMKDNSNKYIRNIQSGVKTIQHIYEDLSYLIKKDRVTYKKENINFTDILKQRLEFFNEIASANELFFVTNIQDAIYMSFNNTLLSRLIDNNISNALKYSFKDEAIFIKLLQDDNGVSFEVKTQSEKIDNPDQIFNDFYRENDVRGGFGLGLKIVKEICDKNNVIITLTSTSKDTKFNYRFKTNENITS